jgi:hypothetical protein
VSTQEGRKTDYIIYELRGIDGRKIGIDRQDEHHAGDVSRLGNGGIDIARERLVGVELDIGNASKCVGSALLVVNMIRRSKRLISSATHHLW